MTSNSPSLTLAYVTYNRKKLIVNKVKNLLKMKVPSYIEIIIIDDCSSDGTYDELDKITENTFIKVYKNKSNYGFSRNYYEAIHKANGEYVVWVSDKDGFSISGINNFLDWSRNKKIDATVLNYKRNLQVKDNHKKILRNNKTRLIRYNELWKCSHGPGIVWKRKSLINLLEDWSFLNENYFTFTKYYPNLALLIRLMPKGKCYFYNGEITFQDEYADFSHFLENEDTYSYMKSRWQQHKNLLGMLAFYSKKHSEYEGYYSLMSHSLNLNLHSFISTALREERPDLYAYWWKSFSSPIQIFNKALKFTYFIIIQLLQNPLWTFKRIKKRLTLIFVK